MAAMLAPAGVAGISAVRPVQRAFSSHHQRRPRTVMAVRAEDAKVTREFKEGDAKATPAKGDGALYADQIKVHLLATLRPGMISRSLLHGCTLLLNLQRASPMLTRCCCCAVPAEELNVAGALRRLCCSRLLYLSDGCITCLGISMTLRRHMCSESILSTLALFGGFALRHDASALQPHCVCCGDLLLCNGLLALVLTLVAAPSCLADYQASRPEVDPKPRL